MTSYKPKKEVKEEKLDTGDLDIIGWLILVGMIIAVWVAMVKGFNKQIDNQNIMLCESAKLVGNVETEKRCAEYYKTNDITKVREEMAK